MTDRIDGGLKLIEPTHAKFIKHLIEGNSPRATHIRNDLASLREKFAGVIEVWWEDILTLDRATPRETIVRAGRLLSLVDSIPTFLPHVGSYEACLLSIDKAIEYREQLTEIAQKHYLPAESLEFLHRYVRDGLVWEAVQWAASGTLQISIIAAVGRAKIEKRDGKEFYVVPVDEASSTWTHINPIGDWSELNSIFDGVLGNLKRYLAPDWNKRPRRRDPAVAAHCAYLRVVERLPPLKVWDLALRDIAGGWRDGENVVSTKKRKVEQYVADGRKVLGWGRGGPSA
jgi:hypothetical protein